MKGCKNCGDQWGLCPCENSFTPYYKTEVKPTETAANDLYSLITKRVTAAYDATLLAHCDCHMKEAGRLACEAVMFIERSRGFLELSTNETRARDREVFPDEPWSKTAKVEEENTALMYLSSAIERMRMLEGMVLHCPYCSKGLHGEKRAYE